MKYRNLISCWTRLHGKPDYEQMKNVVTENPNVEYLNTLMMADWPADQIFPPSFEEFAQKLHRTFWLIMSSLFGFCEDY